MTMATFGLKRRKIQGAKIILVIDTRWKLAPQVENSSSVMMENRGTSVMSPLVFMCTRKMPCPSHLPQVKHHMSNNDNDILSIEDFIYVRNRIFVKLKAFYT